MGYGNVWIKFILGFLAIICLALGVVSLPEFSDVGSLVHYFPISILAFCAFWSAIYCAAEGIGFLDRLFYPKKFLIDALLPIAEDHFCKEDNVESLDPCTPYGKTTLRKLRKKIED